MSKKKSYMNKENILSEGLLDNILKFFKMGKKSKRERLSSEDKKILKDPIMRAAISDFYKQYNSSMKKLKKSYDKHGFEYPDWVDWKK